jgi:hypothetical protein
MPDGSVRLVRITACHLRGVYVVMIRLAMVQAMGGSAAGRVVRLPPIRGISTCLAAVVCVLPL